jgi:hypothetical protein
LTPLSKSTNITTMMALVAAEAMELELLDIKAEEEPEAP